MIVKEVLNGINTLQKNTKMLPNKMKQHMDFTMWENNSTLLYKSMPIPGTCQVQRIRTIKLEFKNVLIKSVQESSELVQY